MQVDYTPQITDEMRARYVSRRQADLEIVETAVDSLDFVKLGEVAHQIKGNASTFSFDSLEKIAIDLENAAKAKSQADCRLALSSFRAWLQAQS